MVSSKSLYFAPEIVLVRAKVQDIMKMIIAKLKTFLILCYVSLQPIFFQRINSGSTEFLHLIYSLMIFLYWTLILDDNVDERAEVICLT
jgi:hypothetical protein